MHNDGIQEINDNTDDGTGAAVPEKKTGNH